MTNGLGLPGPVRTVPLSYFGEREVPLGGLLLIDGGIDGVQGHSLLVWAGGAARWERRLDGVRPVGQAGAGTVCVEQAELNGLWGWRAAILAAHAGRSLRLYPDFTSCEGPPRWVWAIVIEESGVLTHVEGGAAFSFDAAPLYDPALRFVRDSVDRYSTRHAS